MSQRHIDWVLLDPNRFLQIVINLVTNAIKFTRTSLKREINISVSASLEPPQQDNLGVDFVPRRYDPAHPTDRSGDVLDESQLSDEIYICFRVEDTGKGMTSEERALLFNRFQQASPKTHIEYGGSGLGLFISRQITEMLGGEIGMSSGGTGSTFAFYVRTCKTSPPRRPSVSIEPILQMTRTMSLNSSTSPLVIPSSPDDKHGPAFDVTLVTPAANTNNSTINTAERHILVVEDNVVNQRVLCKLLRNRSFVVESANHGQEALVAIQAQREREKDRNFDVILCDIEMPVMGGIEFATEVRSQESAGQMPGHVPIIGVTANVRSQQVSGAIEAGMVSYFASSVDESIY